MGLFTGVFDIWYRFTANPNYVRSSGYGPCVGYTPHMLMAGVLMLKTFCALVLN